MSRERVSLRISYVDGRVGTCVENCLPYRILPAAPFNPAADFFGGFVCPNPPNLVRERDTITIPDAGNAKT